MAFLHGASATHSGPKSGLKSRSYTPYLLLAPGLIWLITFFIIPIFSLASTSTMVRPEGAQIGTYVQELRFQNYVDAFVANQEQYVRSFVYAGIATILALAIAYPLAYMIAFKSGKYRNILLVLVVAPFFTSFLLRTVAWTQILGDEGPVVSTLKLLPFLDYYKPLPLYASLERIDPRTLEAAGDLYANGFTTFRKVTVPLSMPGVVAGTLLTFIPAAGDYVNAALLGNPNTKMIGNVIESRFFAVVDYPTAAALSFTLMATILILVTLYIRRSGTDELV
jgi:spermidine/putrescine transport system permease protein